ncbi:MAG: CrcB family protein [Candidatus Methanoplasma sp.]|nr:CrcB family protein [Candidatus Methanoplasma sp.]
MAEASLTSALLVMAGGAIGALLRYAVALMTSNYHSLPLSTLLVNFAGCTLLVLFFFLWNPLPDNARLFFFIGVFGAFTTMSSVSLETISLYVEGHPGIAALNFALNVCACAGGAILGRAAAVLLS